MESVDNFLTNSSNFFENETIVEHISSYLHAPHCYTTIHHQCFVVWQYSPTKLNSICILLVLYLPIRYGHIVCV